MNKKLYTLCAIVAAFVLAGCQKENNSEPAYVGPTHTVTFTAEKMIDTKTAIDTEGNGVVSYKWLSDDDERMEILEYYEYDDNGTTKTKCTKGTITGMTLSNNDKSATFTATFSGDAPDALIGYRAAYAGTFANTSHNPKIPAAQSPLPNTFDPNADVLVSDLFADGRDMTTFVFNMTRMVSVNKMTLKGLEEGEVISSVTFESDKQHAATYVIPSNSYSGEGKKLTFTFTSNNTVPASGEFPVYFTTAPVDDATFTVSVVTDQHKYRKTSSKTITFATGSVRRFGVDLAGCEVADGRTFTLVENVSSLSIGSDVVIAANGSKNIAMSTTQNSNNRGETEAVKSSDWSTIAVDPEVVQIFTLTNGTTAGTYAFLCKNGTQENKFIYAAGSGSGKNYLRSQSDLNANASWTINISDKEATITAQGDNTNNILRYNTGSSMFSCYSSGQQTVFIYQATGLPASELSFTNASYTFTLDDTDYNNFTGQALNNPNSISDITWSSSNTSLATVSDGVITWVPDATGTTTITATFAGDEFFGPGSASYTITVNAAAPAVENVTVAEFLAKAVNNTNWYQLTGEISDITSTVYGNFTLTDATGSVAVYGLTATQQESNDKSFAGLGLEEGFTVTLIALRSEYNNTPQTGGPAYYVSHIGVSVSPKSMNFDATGGIKTAIATYAGFDDPVTITASSNNAQFSTSVTGNTVSVTASANQSNAEINGTVTVTATDGTTTKTATISILQAKPVSQAEDGDILWQEDFTGYGTSMPASASGSHVYEGGTVTYTLTNGGTTTKLYAEASAGGTSPELLISKNNGAFSISGIPTGGASTMTLTFKSNHGNYCSISSATSGITVGTPSISGSVVSVTITANSGVASFDLVITNTNSSNTRVDDFSLVVGVPARTLDSIAVSGQTLSYTVGDTFTFDGTVTATYSNGSTADVTSSATISSPSLSTEGQKTVTVSYTEGGVTKTTSYTITVNAGGGDETTEEITGTFSFSNNVLSLTTSSGITITQQKVSGSNNPNNSYNTATTLRVYVGNSISFSGKTITKIEFTHTSNYKGSTGISANVGTYSQGTTSSIWTGEATNVTITNSGGTTAQLRPTKIVVTYKD